MQACNPVSNAPTRPHANLLLIQHVIHTVTPHSCRPNRELQEVGFSPWRKELQEVAIMAFFSHHFFLVPYLMFLMVSLIVLSRKFICLILIT